jgi:hypothetical protein
MLNIIIPCTPNYSKKNVINTVNKKIDIVSQFIILYNSIKQNWNFDLKINLFYNKNYNFNNVDTKRLSALDIDIFAVEPDNRLTPFMVRCNALTHNLRQAGTHRLLLDCDMIALCEPNFDLSCDWQAMFAGGVLDKKWYEFINKNYEYNLKLDNKYKGNLFKKYVETGEYENFFPHFNGGAFLIKEELCEEFKNYTSMCYNIVNNNNLPYNIRHIGVQYGASFALIKISQNWKPFDLGVNFLLKHYLFEGGNLEKFNKNNIKLLHYCGKEGYDIAYKHFKEEIDFFGNKN